MLTSDWLPAWVQALGSVLAIAVAMAIVIFQHRLDRDRDVALLRRAHVERLKSLEVAIELLRDFLLLAISDNPASPDPSHKPDTAVFVDFYRNHVGLARETAERFNITDVREPDLVRAWGFLFGALRYSDAAFDALEKASFDTIEEKRLAANASLEHPIIFANEMLQEIHRRVAGADL